MSSEQQQLSQQVTEDIQNNTGGGTAPPDLSSAYTFIEQNYVWSDEPVYNGTSLGDIQMNAQLHESMANARPPAPEVGGGSAGELMTTPNPDGDCDICCCFCCCE